MIVFVRNLARDILVHLDTLLASSPPTNLQNLALPPSTFQHPLRGSYKLCTTGEVRQSSVISVPNLSKLELPSSTAEASISALI